MVSLSCVPLLDFPRLKSLVSLHGVVCLADVLLSPSKWHQMHWSGDKATLTLTHLNKEDEGLYTLRVTTKSGYETYSAYVFVRGERPRTAHIAVARHSTSKRFTLASHLPMGSC